VVKSFVREDYEKQKFEKASEDVRVGFTKAEKIISFNSPMMQFCLYVNMVLILTLGSYTIITTQGLQFNVGQLSALMVYSFQILNSLMMLSMVLVMVTIADESKRRITEVLQEKSTLTNPVDPVREVKDGTIDFIGVNFKYSEKAERMALTNIDLHIGSGETIGILGGTGSSKTSLVQLIPRLYDATEGTVRVGGLDVRNYDIESLRNQVSMVLQNNVLFSGTIRENLLWGDPSATDEELRTACILAQADEFISGFPEGYNTHIEQGGTNVSGGQKQRLCITRALLKKPKILILDDSTSAVDTHTDAKIRKAFLEAIPDTTKIIIAQRVASVLDADRIILMDKGGIAAVGNHMELLEQSDIYREIYKSQNRVGEQL
jgi:ATP-binding cassette subfamily B protein